MSRVKCSGCGKVFAADSHSESGEFDMHDCPATPEPIKGESWADYSQRCKVAARKYQAQKGAKR